MGYSSTHHVAIRKYLDAPGAIRSMPDDELASLLEDANFSGEVGRERERRSQMVAPLPPAPVVKSAPANVTDDATDWATLTARHGREVARKSLVFTFIKTVADAIRETRATHAARLASLEQRLTVLEQRPAQKSSGTWCGTFDETRSYPEAALVTHGGGLWLTTRTTAGTRPGDSTGAFVLVCKRGDYRGGDR